ncbi:hypothetical protein HN011_002953 [Eciton burchellii]|nr:hypothetical protein HN011_002953 [Eciton burchellii]
MVLKNFKNCLERRNHGGKGTANSHLDATPQIARHFRAVSWHHFRQASGRYASLTPVSHVNGCAQLCYGNIFRPCQRAPCALVASRANAEATTILWTESFRLALKNTSLGDSSGESRPLTAIAKTELALFESSTCHSRS